MNSFVANPRSDVEKGVCKRVVVVVVHLPTRQPTINRTLPGSRHVNKPLDRSLQLQLGVGRRIPHRLFHARRHAYAH
jgi:hypothetical protein